LSADYKFAMAQCHRQHAASLRSPELSCARTRTRQHEL